MNDLFVNNIPSIQRKTFNYRSKMNSDDLNEIQKQSLNDILDLFNKANRLQKQVYEMNQYSQIETACCAKRLDETQKKLAEITEKYNNLNSDDNAMRTISQYAFRATTDDDNYSAIIDENTSDIIAGIVSSISKTRIYDETYDESLIPDSLKVLIGPDSFKVGEHILSIEDNDIMNAFDGNQGTSWFRRIVTDPTIDSIENEIIIGLPENIITTRLINQITINPYPIGYVDVLSIQYKSNGSWVTIPGFENHDGCIEREGTDIFGNKYDYNVIEDASAMKFNFTSVQANQIKIKLKQRHYTYDAENNRRIWYIGLRDVDVIFNRYARDHSEFSMVYEFTEDRNIKVYDSDIVYNNGTEFNVYKEYYYFDSNGNAHKVPSSCPFVLDGHKLKVKYTIEGTQDTPNIYKCVVRYKLS